MGDLSDFSQTGLLELSDEPSPAEVFYDLLWKLYGGDRGPFNLTPGATYKDAQIYAAACMLGRAQVELQHAGEQADPTLVFDLLPLAELDFGLVPGPQDTVAQRRGALVARQLLPQGARASAIVAGLRAILGPALLSYCPIVSTFSSASPTVYPSSPGAGPGLFQDVRVPPRHLALLDPVANTVTQWVGYQNLDPSVPAQRLVIGDKVVVQGENTSQAEQVTVLAVATQPPAGSNASSATLPAGTTTWAPSTLYAPGSYVTPTAANTNGFYFYTATGGLSGATEPTWPNAIGQNIADGAVTWGTFGASFCFQATFTKAHDVGASVIAGNFPYWWSTARLSWIVVTAAAAKDPETRRKVDDYMRRAARGVSQWAIVSPTSQTAFAGTVGPTTVGGALGTQVLASQTYQNTM